MVCFQKCQEVESDSENETTELKGPKNREMMPSRSEVESKAPQLKRVSTGRSIVKTVPHNWASQEWDSLYLPPTAVGPMQTAIFHSARSRAFTSDFDKNKGREACWYGGIGRWIWGQAPPTAPVKPVNPLLMASPVGSPTTRKVQFLSPSASVSYGSQVVTPAMLGRVPVSPQRMPPTGRPGSMSGYHGGSVLTPLTASAIGGTVMTDSLRENVQGLPAAQAPGEVPFYHATFPGKTLKHIKKALRAVPFILEKVFEEQGATEMSTSAWQQSAGEDAGTFVRGMRFMLPLPKDVQIIQMPDFSRVTTAVRLKETDKEVVMLYQTTTHDAPFGETFRVQDTLTFTEDEEGVVLNRWCEIIWVGSLPWGMGMVIKPAVESSVKAKSAESQPRFVEMIQKAID